MPLDIVNPNEDLQIPKWVTAEYFVEILEKDVPDYAKILEFTPVAAIPPGENFTSVMLRICMLLEMKDGSIKPKSYILKTMLDDDRGGDFVKELSLFPKETDMYRTYLPDFEAMYKEAGLDIQLAPKCLKMEITDNQIYIIFEDLKEKKFANADRLEGFDMQHMRLVLRKLAELHAASAVWAECNGPFPKEFNYGFIKADEGREMQKKMYELKENSYKEAMSNWNISNTEEYIKKFPTFDQYWKCGLRSMVSDPNDFNVLNHGDFWSSNIMFNYLQNGDIDKLMIVDYQICKWGSPAQDLLFFISISAAKDIRVKEFEHFVAIYHERLIECLKVLKYSKPLPTLRELQMSMYKENNAFYAFFAIYNHIVVLSLPSDKDSNIHTYMRDDEFGHRFRLRAFTNDRYVEAMQDLYPFFYNRGILNFEDYD